MLNDMLLQPGFKPPYAHERSYRKCALEFRSAVICGDMAEAAFARDLPRMVTTTLRLREFITDVVNPFFGCDNEEVFLELDGHVARLRHLIATRQARAS
jgi:hypothetical protein